MPTLKKSPTAPTAVKPVPAPKSTSKATTKVSVAKEVKVEKVKKPKLIRDSFTIPKAEYLVIETLKERAGKLSRAAKKSELLRCIFECLSRCANHQNRPPFDCPLNSR
jgi:hypothetical protein